MTLPRSTPAAAGMDARGVLDFLDAAATAQLDLHSLMIARRGSVIAEGWWLPYSADRIHLGYSLSKSFTATAIGTLVDDGRVGLDDVVLDYFPWVDRSDVDPKYSRLLVRHCLAMTVGHTQDVWEEVANDAFHIIGGADDPMVTAIFATAPEQEPGSVFAYNQVATYLLGAIVRAATGADLLDRVTERFLRPLQLPEARWHATPRGDQLGFSGIHVTTETILTLAQLYADGGQAGGTRLLSAAYVEEAVRGAGPARRLPNPSPDWNCGYGFSFWQARHGYRGDGAYGQFAIVLPEHDLTIAITSEVEEMQTVLDLVWEHVLPAVDREVDAMADSALADRLARLTIDPLPSTQHGPASAWWRVTGDAVAQDGVWSLRSTGVGWELSSTTWGEPVTLMVGDGAWTETVLRGCGMDLPVVASGGWVGERFAADIRLIETPHRLLLRAREQDATLNWRYQPLTGLNPFATAVRRART